MPCSHQPPPDAPDALRVDDAHLTETVLLLARGIATDSGFDRLPILADALEDAGCDNLGLLHHLRSAADHVVECWALRRLLRTTLTLPGGVPITFAYCPPGSFLMGRDLPQTAYDEKPVRRVTLTRGFYAGIHPVTQAQWSALTDTAPPPFRTGRQPVTGVSWRQAVGWCGRAAAAGLPGVRLPTEAEWEYACRAGTETDYHFGDEWAAERMHSNHTVPLLVRPSDGVEPTPVGRYEPPNPWGLYDCHGNVWEWCEDVYHPLYYSTAPDVDPVCRAEGRDHRVIRGGSFRSPPHWCRSASRYSAYEYAAWEHLGFRAVFTA